MKILLLSEAPLCVNCGGMAQTLYNVFSFCDRRNILSIAPKSEIKSYPPTSPFEDSYIGYNFYIIKPLRNRFGKYTNPFIEWFNYSINQYRSFKALKRKINSFQPDVVISCPNGSIGVFMHKKLLKESKVRVFPYFMDDWMYTKKFEWWRGNLHSLIKEMLNRNKRWLMISEELGKLLQERYDTTAEKILVVHNPINLSNAPVRILLQNKKEYTFAYAGSLWAMHRDAFLNLAKGLGLVNHTIPVKLNLYTSKSFWELNKKDLENCPVAYGGSIAYENIHDVLNQADVLIVSSSFLPDYYTHTKASIQTKITDYLKCRKLVISVGPSYSANSNFIKKHQCGLCVETSDPVLISEKIIYFLSRIDSYQNLVDNGWTLLNEQFSFDKVHSKVKNFLN